MGIGRMRASIAPSGKRRLCEPVPPNNNIGRQSCGLIYYGGAADIPPAALAITLQDHGHWESGSRALVNDDLNGRNYDNNPFPFTANPVVQGSTCEEFLVPLRNGIDPHVYVQADTGYEHADIFPSFRVDAAGLNGAAPGDAVLESIYDHLAGGAGTTVCRWVGSISGAGAGQGMLATAGARLAFEIRADNICRGWSDAGGDARVTGLGNWTGLAGRLVQVWVKVKNGVNGFKGRGQVYGLLVTKARGVNLNVPGALSVRITVNGVVQSFAGPVGYLAMPGGVAVYDPAPGIWWPSLVRYEFFSGAALGGVLIADVTVPRAWGGDAMGAV